MALVETANLPLPTVEVPEVSSLFGPTPARVPSGFGAPDNDTIMVDSRFLSPPLPLPRPQSFGGLSPPKTPDNVATDWAMSTPEPGDDTFRNPTPHHYDSDSDDSSYCGRESRPSDDGSCTSPESDGGGHFFSPTMDKGKSLAVKEPLRYHPLNMGMRTKSRANAPWTEAQQDHLWATFHMYLNDATVTPFRLAANDTPPDGVARRVAREAVKSWKGPKKVTILRATRMCSPSTSASRTTHTGASVTPKAEEANVYAPWPHSKRSTRRRLRYLCKTQYVPVSRHRHFQSRSPTAFTQPQRPKREAGYRCRPPGASVGTRDIAMSLATSISESMQPDAPLARLAGSSSAMANAATEMFGQPLAHTYGPSSSRFTHGTRPAVPRVQCDNTEGPHLASPFPYQKSRSLNATQKRRAQSTLEDELGPGGAVVRPTVLDEVLYGADFKPSRRVRRSRGATVGDEALGHHVSDVFTPREEPSERTLCPRTPPHQIMPDTNLMPPQAFHPPPRLASPFSESGPNATFPRRIVSNGDATIRRNRFATMQHPAHQTRRSIESFDFGQGPSLHTRLQQLNNRAKEVQRHADLGNSYYRNR